MGWLGWAPDVAWSVPLPELFLAMDARIEWAQMTNPFGRKTPSTKKPEARTVADKLKSALRSRGRPD